MMILSILYNLKKKIFFSRQKCPHSVQWDPTSWSAYESSANSPLRIAYQLTTVRLIKKEVIFGASVNDYDQRKLFGWVNFNQQSRQAS